MYLRQISAKMWTTSVTTFQRHFWTKDSDMCTDVLGLVPCMNFRLRPLLWAVNQQGGVVSVINVATTNLETGCLLFVFNSIDTALLSTCRPAMCVSFSLADVLIRYPISCRRQAGSHLPLLWQPFSRFRQRCLFATPVTLSTTGEMTQTNI